MTTADGEGEEDQKRTTPKPLFDVEDGESRPTLAVSFEDIESEYDSLSESPSNEGSDYTHFGMNALDEDEELSLIHI